MTRTLERDARIERGRLVIELPADVPDGPVYVLLTLETAPPNPHDAAAWLHELEATSLAGWPAASPLSREDLYGDDGR